MALTDLVFVLAPAPDADLVFGGVTRITDLVFTQPAATHPADLVFGGDSNDTHPDATFDIASTLPALQGTLSVALGVRMVLAGVLPGLSGGLAVIHDNQTQRPTVAHCQTFAQVAAPAESGLTQPQHHAQPANSGVQHQALEAVYAHVGNTPAFATALPANTITNAQFQDGEQASVRLLGQWQDGDPEPRINIRGCFEDGTPARSRLHGRFEDGLRDRRRSHTSSWQEAATHRKGYTGRAGPAKARQLYRDSRFQNAWVPRPGQYVRPTIPVTPPPYFGPALVFACPPLELPNLVFGITQCNLQPQGIVVVPIRKVYIVINDASLRRVDGNIQLPTFTMGLSLDVDSWTWGFNASLPADTLANLEPASTGAPVEVEAMINGVAYRALVETISRSRSFGKSTITIQGRGKAALLDSPYAPVSNFTNISARTAQQLIGDVLSVNNVPMDWVVAFGLTDWLVPAGVFAYQGSYIGALGRIAESVGGYIQPHASAQAISVLPRYPSTPWSWGSVTPDFELPSAVTTTEGIAWADKARYNRVFVSGAQQGVLGQVTRTGTAGDLLAPMITDALITHADAARQRGLSVLANTGRKANITLTLPVLAETGIITPGKFVRYVDGGTARTGIVRSVGVEIGHPDIYQTLGVETHVN